MMKYLLSVAIGAGAGYFYAQFKLQQRFEEDLKVATKEAKNRFRGQYEKKLETAKREAEVEALRSLGEDAKEEQKAVVSNPPVSTSPLSNAARALTDYKGISTASKPEEPKEDDSLDERAPEPHEISIEDFKENASGYKQYSITYYVEDDIFAGQSDQVIREPERSLVLGKANIEKIKSGFGDSDAFYVRAPVNKMELEVVRVENSYANVVGDPNLSSSSDSME